MKKIVKTPFSDIDLNNGFLRWKMISGSTVPTTHAFLVRVVDKNNNPVLEEKFEPSTRKINLLLDITDWESQILKKPKAKYSILVDFVDENNKTISTSGIQVKMGFPWYKRLIYQIPLGILILASLAGVHFWTRTAAKDDSDNSVELEESRLLLKSTKDRLLEAQNIITKLKSPATTDNIADFTTTTNVVVVVTNTTPIPTKLPTPPSSGVAVGIGTLNGDINLNVGSDGQLTIGADKDIDHRSRNPRRLDGMPDKPAYETNILDKAISPRKGLELSVYMEVPPGNGVRFIKPDGWRVISEVYAGADYYASEEQYQRVVNVNSYDNPDWIKLELASKRQTPIKVESFWIRSTTKRTLLARFMLTYDHDPETSSP